MEVHQTIHMVQIAITDTEMENHKERFQTTQLPTRIQ